MVKTSIKPVFDIRAHHPISSFNKVWSILFEIERKTFLTKSPTFHFSHEWIHRSFFPFTEYILALSDCR
ncbi:unnamed protein product [Schistosoma mattheei]|uniref:Uncharacterized protein n=1 Tax=Schistosoma mattheei TaxID=31246 RepID=A0AA85BHW0_9TREM|nr:unnamed protein product [Schistosoma mattheei]